ncbi:MAG: SRPBCC domain-containing protein [Pseudomonadota bacterium]
MLDPICKTVRVPGSPDRAFEIFTRKIADWWPVEEFSVSAGQSGVPITVVFEVSTGGRVYEVMPDGTESTWAEVLECQTGEGFVLNWHPGRDASEGTRVSVAFAASDAGTTEVTLVHDGWQTLGDQAEKVHGNYDGGWALVLGVHFVGVFEEQAAE